MDLKYLVCLVGSDSIVQKFHESAIFGVEGGGEVEDHHQQSQPIPRERDKISKIHRNIHA